MNIFNNAFGSTTTADGVSLINAAHLLPSGGTWRNRLSADSDLSESTLKTALADFDEVFVGDSGIIYPMKPKILLVHSSQKRYAQELVGSDLRPDGEYNNINSIKNDNLIVVGSPHLTDRDAWFVLSDKKDHGLRIVNRSGIQTKSNEEFKDDSILYKARYREAIGALHGMGIVGTPGA
jgi:hypothetical protein